MKPPFKDPTKNVTIIPSPNTCHLLCDLQHAVTIYTAYKTVAEDVEPFEYIWKIKYLQNMAIEELENGNCIFCWGDNVPEQVLNDC